MNFHVKNKDVATSLVAAFAIQGSIYLNEKEKVYKNSLSFREVMGACMESPFYFECRPTERKEIVQNLSRR